MQHILLFSSLYLANCYYFGLALHHNILCKNALEIKFMTTLWLSKPKSTSTHFCHASLFILMACNIIRRIWFSKTRSCRKKFWKCLAVFANVSGFSGGKSVDLCYIYYINWLFNYKPLSAQFQISYINNFLLSL